MGVTTSKVLATNGDESFVVSFATAVSAFGFDACFDGLGPTALKAFNGAGQIDGTTTPGVLHFKGHIGVAGVGAIPSFSWATAAGGNRSTGLELTVPGPTYLRQSKQRRADGGTVSVLQLAENVVGPERHRVRDARGLQLWPR